MSNGESEPIDLPRYKCHKVVQALKIGSIIKDCDDDHSAKLVPSNQNYSAIKVDQRFMDKHNPQAGGYYVIYENGYASFSPADAFESGYAILT